MKSKTVTCTMIACYEIRALGQEQLAFKRLKENLICVCLLNHSFKPKQMASNRYKQNRLKNQLLAKHFKDFKH